MSTHNGLNLTPLYMMPRHINTNEGALYTLEDGNTIKIPKKIIEIAKQRQNIYREELKKKQK